MAKRSNKKNKPFLIYSYTRQQAIEDGYLIDVTDLAKQAGFTLSVVVTDALWQKYCDPEAGGTDPVPVLRDVLWMLRCAIGGTLPSRREQTGGGEIVFFSFVAGLGSDRETLADLKAEIGPGDHSEPVLTVMLPDES